MIHTCKLRWSLHSVCSSLMRYAKLLRHLKILMIHMCASPCFCCETADFWQTKRTMIYQTYFSSGKQIINSRHSCSRNRCTTIMNKVRSYTHALNVCVHSYMMYEHIQTDMSIMGHTTQIHTCTCLCECTGRFLKANS